MPRKQYLYVGCMGSGCTSRYPRYWYHSDCGGKMYIRDDAYFQCSSCGEDGILFEWYARCSDHKEEYRAVSIQGVAYALQVMISLNVDSSFISSLSLSIQKNAHRAKA